MTRSCRNFIPNRSIQWHFDLQHSLIFLIAADASVSCRPVCFVLFVVISQLKKRNDVQPIVIEENGSHTQKALTFERGGVMDV